MTEKINTLKSELSLTVPGCPDNMMLMALRRGAREFCNRTGVWVGTLTLDAVSETAQYAFDMSDYPRNVLIKAIEEVRLNGVKVADAGYRLGGDRLSLIFETGYIPGESVTDGLAVDISIFPKQGCTEFPDSLLEEYDRAVIGWATYYLCRQRRRPWTDPDLARDGYMDYQSGVQDALIRLNSDGRADSVGFTG